MLSSSSTTLTAVASLALRRASGAATGVSNGRDIASALTDSFPAVSLALGRSLKLIFVSRSVSSTATSTSSSSPPLPPSARADFAYCADLVQKNDPENYLWAMELPKAQRAVALALRAFNVETATAADAASAHSRKAGVPSSSSSSSSSSADHQAALASARLLWWKEAVAEAVAGGARNAPPNHPVVRALAAVAASGAVAPRSLSTRLSRVAAARAEDAAARGRGAVPRTIKDLEAYGEATAAQLLYLQLEAALGAKGGGGDSDHAASHLGRAAAIASLLRGMRSHASDKRCYLPLSELEKAGTSAQELFEAAEARAEARRRAEGGASPLPPGTALFDFPDPLREATRAVASAALAHLSAARGLAGRLPGGAAPCLLQSVSVSKYLGLLERTGFDALRAEDEVGAGASPAARARYRAALAVETRWRGWRGTY